MSTLPKDSSEPSDRDSIDHVAQQRQGLSGGALRVPDVSHQDCCSGGDVAVNNARNGVTNEANAAEELMRMTETAGTTEAVRPAETADAREESAGVTITTFAQGVTPYTPVSSQAKILAASKNEPSFKLDWNESTIKPSPLVAKAIATYLEEGFGLNWYPELESQTLLNKLTSYTNLDSKYLLATSGSDDALSLLCTCFINPGEEVVVPVPTYNHFVVFAQAHGASVKEVLSADPFAPNLDAVRAAIQPDTRIVYLISPNNPTGSLVRSADVASLCQDYPGTLFLLDEAYYEFAQVSGIELVREHKNLIVTRTFSKAFGLAGLRVGYLAAHPTLLDGVKRLYNPKSVNTLAQVGAAAALDDLPYLHSYLDEVRQSKELYAAFFEKCSHFEATITPANFIVLRVANPAATIAKLESSQIYVRDRSNYPGMTNCLRMSVGNVAQTQEVIRRLQVLFPE